MNRRNFFKYFGFGAAAVVATPIIIETILKGQEIPSEKYIAGSDPIQGGSQGIGLHKYISDESHEYVMYTGQKGMEAFNEVVHELAKKYRHHNLHQFMNSF